MSLTRTCTKCRQQKIDTEFYQRSNGSLTSHCKECTKAATQARLREPAAPGVCACGRRLRQTGKRPARACVVCRGLAVPCACGGMKSRNAERCSECVRASTRKLNARVCPRCAGPKSYHALHCARCTYAPEGTRREREGYVLVKLPTGQWRGEHIAVMQKVLGRDLLPGETVHHKNGVRNDNTESNLELFVVSQPRGQRPGDLVAWARMILDRYESEVV